MSERIVDIGDNPRHDLLTEVLNIGHGHIIAGCYGSKHGGDEDGNLIEADDLEQPFYDNEYSHMMADSQGFEADGYSENENDEMIVVAFPERGFSYKCILANSRNGDLYEYHRGRIGDQDCLINTGTGETVLLSQLPPLDADAEEAIREEKRRHLQALYDYAWDTPFFSYQWESWGPHRAVNTVRSELLEIAPKMSRGKHALECGRHPQFYGNVRIHGRSH